MTNFNSIQFLKNEGFKGFISYRNLNMNEGSISERPGIYFVINPNYKKPEFINPEFVDHIKEKILTTVLNILKKYVKNAQVMYIGKAGGTGVNATLTI